MPTFRTDDGVRLHYLDEGAGSPVVLIAGFRAPATSWLYQVPALVAAGHRVIALDRRSHGKSEDPAGGHTMERHGRDIANFLDGLDLPPAVLVGGSMGASTIWSYLAQSGTGRVRGVVSIDQTPKMLNTEDWPYGFYGYTEAERDTMFAAGIPNTGRTPKRDAAATRRMMKAFGGLIGMFRSRKLSPHALSLLNDHAKADWRSVLDGVDVPVLMVAGRSSDYWPCEHASASAGPQVRAEVIEDSGHAVNIEQPDAFNQTLLDFIAKLD
jgi:pimeloyl-ACP methyl ester carboxylesterase